MKTRRPQTKFTEEATPTQLEGTMPREVAISMLSAPKAKLTNKQRKRCKLALVRAFPGGTLVRVLPKDAIDRTLFVADNYPSSAQAQFNSDARMRSAAYLQLMRWKLRAERQREAGQAAYLRLSVEPADESSRDKAFRLRQCALVENAVALLDLRRDIIETELERRTAVMVGNRAGKPEIDPAKRRRAALLATVGV